MVGAKNKGPKVVDSYFIHGLKIIVSCQSMLGVITIFYFILSRYLIYVAVGRMHYHLPCKSAVGPIPSLLFETCHFVNYLSGQTYYNCSQRIRVTRIIMGYIHVCSFFQVFVSLS